MRKMAIATVLLLALLLTLPMTAAASPQPTVEGEPPPALAPYAENDPIPKLQLKPHVRQSTPLAAAESFLAHLSVGYELPDLGVAGGSVGDPQAYDQAWELLGPGRAALPEFRRQWQGTARLGVIQLEPTDAHTFFVELERVEWCGDHWAVSYYTGDLTTVATPAGWRIGRFRVEPEHLVRSNIGGHNPVQHDGPAMAMIWYRQRSPDQGGRLERLSYQRRTLTARIRTSQKTGEVWLVRIARTIEGSWVLLRISQQPATTRVSDRSDNPRPALSRCTAA